MRPGARTLSIARTLTALLLAAIVFGCSGTDAPPVDTSVIVDVEGLPQDPADGLISLRQCCLGAVSKRPCHAYNCGDATKGCIRWCAAN